MRRISTSNGWRSRRSVDFGLRPSASEICRPKPANFPRGEDHEVSGTSFVLTLRSIVRIYDGAGSGTCREFSALSQEARIERYQARGEPAVEGSFGVSGT